MAYDNTLTLCGNIVRDPELHFLGSGLALTKFSIADNQKTESGEEKAHYFDCVAWRDLAEHIAESFRGGERVIIHGKLKQDKWEDDDGKKRSKVEVTVEDCGHSLKWATSVATKQVATKQTKEGRSAPKMPKRETPATEPF